MATKKAAKKAPAPKAAVKKAPAPKAAAKKAPAPKAAVKKKAAPKTVKKVAAKKKTPATEPTPITSVIAKVDIGFGNELYLRGEGAGLSWETGVKMDWTDGSWSWSSASAKGDVAFKFLINDEVWSEGENFVVADGDTAVVTPAF